MKKFFSFLLLLALVIGSEFLINGAGDIIAERGNLEIQKENAFKMKSTEDNTETDNAETGENQKDYVEVEISRSTDGTDIAVESEESETVQE